MYLKVFKNILSLFNIWKLISMCLQRVSKVLTNHFKNQISENFYLQWSQFESLSIYLFVFKRFLIYLNYFQEFSNALPMFFKKFSSKNNFINFFKNSCYLLYIFQKFFEIFELIIIVSKNFKSFSIILDWFFNWKEVLKLSKHFATRKTFRKSYKIFLKWFWTFVIIWSVFFFLSTFLKIFDLFLIVCKRF